MKLSSLLIVSLLCAPLAVSADEVEDQIRLGLEAYQGKEYKAAIDDLNYAIAQIQELLNAENANLLPEPLDGWSASEVENTSAGMAMMGGGTHMSRSYQRGAETIEISITAGSPMMTAALAMMNNPMIMSSDPSLKPYRYKRINGMKKTQGSRIEVTLGLVGQIMIQLNATGLADEAAVEQYLDAMDFDRIRDALLQ